MPNPNSDSVRSGGKHPSHRKPSESVDHLLDGAESVFAERGYHSANIHEICARSNVGIGTFYAHFDHKKQLLERVMRERAVTVPDILSAEDLRDREALSSKLRSAVDEPISAGLWRAWHEAVFEHQDIARVHAEWRAAVLARFAGLIREAREAAGSSTKTLDAGVVAWTLLTLYRELAIHDRSGAPDVDELARFSQALIFGLDDGPHVKNRPPKGAAQT
jgi:AcrR family transcriptional regulator